MKVLEIRVVLPNSANDEELNSIGEEFQQSLPVDFEQNGMKVHNVTFEVVVAPAKSYEVRIPPELAYTVERRLMDLAKIHRDRGEVKAIATRKVLRAFRSAIGVLHPVGKAAAILLLCAAGIFGQTFKQQIIATSIGLEPDSIQSSAGRTANTFPVCDKNNPGWHATQPITQQPTIKKPMPRFDTGWWARAHWTSAAFDYATTGNSSSSCHAVFGPNSHNCGEQNPLAQPFIGRYSTPSWRLALGWAGESIAVSAIPPTWHVGKVRLRRATQIGLIGAHLICGANNLRMWH